jgi:uncharacterized protein YbbC (DUF1343 family)
MFSRFVVLLLSFFLFFACRKEMHKPAPKIPVREDEAMVKSPQDAFLLGIDNFILNYTHLVQGKRVGLMTNPSGVNRDLQPTSDILYMNPAINLTAYYGPEHGIRGAHYDGEKYGDMTDNKTGLPIYSLYGKHRKPTPEMLHNVDVIIIDIQDIGLRAYTFIYSMADVMQAAQENGKHVIILDRPNPISGILIEGNIIEKKFFSGIGRYPIPYLHAMTIGELARLFNEEFGIGCDLQVIPMRGWHRSMYWEDTNLSWVPTSQHLPHWETILYMGASGPFGELHTLLPGIGYTSPFEIVGAPWIKEEIFAEKLNSLNLSGVYFRPLHFKPYYSYYAGKMCQGVQMHLTQKRKFKPYVTGLYILQVHIELFPQHDLFAKSDRVDSFNKAVGTDKIMNMLKNKIAVAEIENSWQDELNAFLITRANYLLY